MKVELLLRKFDRLISAVGFIFLEDSEYLVDSALFRSLGLLVEDEIFNNPNRLNEDPLGSEVIKTLICVKCSFVECPEEGFDGLEAGFVLAPAELELKTLIELFVFVAEGLVFDQSHLVTALLDVGQDSAHVQVHLGGLSLQINTHAVVN